MPGFLLTLFLFVGFTVLGELLRPRPKFEKPTASGLGDFRLPTAQEGRPVTAFCGTCHLRGPNVTYYGDLDVVAIKQRVKTGIFSSTKVTTGYRYYLGIQATLGHGPIDEFLEVRFDNRKIPGGTVTVGPDNDGIVGGTTFGPDDTAHIAHGSYSTMSAFAQAAETAMRAVDPGRVWNVNYGYEVLSGRYREIQYAVDRGGVEESTLTAEIALGIYTTGHQMAAAVVAALNTRESIAGTRVIFSGAYSDSTKLFTFTATGTGGFPAVTGWRFKGLSDDQDHTAFPMTGFRRANYVAAGDPSSLVGDYETGPLRLNISFPTPSSELGRLFFGDAAFTSKSLFGITASVTENVGAYVADEDRVLGGVRILSETEDLITLYIDAPTFFGGDEREGGIVGTIELYKGTQTQQPNPYLEEKTASDLPGWPGIVYAVLRGGTMTGGSTLFGELFGVPVRSGMYVGVSAYLKALSFVLRRNPNGLALTDGKHNVGADANPACWLYEIITNATWGCSVPTALVDLVSFTAAAETLYAEGLGVSMIVDSQTTGADLVADVLRHIDGVVYPDPETGKLTLRLAREDYDVEDLPVLDQSNLDDVKFSRPSWDSTVNAVKVRYVDRANDFTERIAQAHDLANIDASGSVREATYDLMGLSTAAAAQRQAERILKTMSYPLAGLELTPNRVAWRMRPADVGLLNWPPDGIVGMPVRVSRIAAGEPTDGRIRVDAVEDVFGVGVTVYEEPDPTGWEEPDDPPLPLEEEALEEAPYAMVVGEERLVMTLGGRSQAGGITLGYQVWSDPAGGSDYGLTNTVPEMTPTGALDADIGYTDVELTIAEGPDTEQLATPSAADFAAGATVLLLEGEMIAFATVTDNGDDTITLSDLVRGVNDTTPKPHSAGARAWIISEGVGTTSPEPYPEDLTVTAKLLPFGPRGAVRLADATQVSETTLSRAQRPYVPRDVELNGVGYPVSISGPLAVSWAHRDRLASWTYDDGGLTAAPETGCTYTLKLYDETDTLVKTEAGLTGTSYTWTTEAADSGLTGRLNTQVRVVLSCVNADDLESYQVYDFTTVRTTEGDEVPFNWIDANMIGTAARQESGNDETWIPTLLLSATGTRYQAQTFCLPSNFGSLTGIKIVYSNVGTSANTWVARVGLRVLADGVDMTLAPTFGANTVLTPPTVAEEVDIKDLNLPSLTLAAGDVMLLFLERLADDASDTNASGMTLIGLRLEYATA